MHVETGDLRASLADDRGFGIFAGAARGGIRRSKTKRPTEPTASVKSDR
jgi:hypothetical protein